MQFIKNSSKYYYKFGKNSLQPPPHIPQLFNLMIIVPYHPFGKLKVIILVVVVPKRFLFWSHVLLHSIRVRQLYVFVLCGIPRVLVRLWGFLLPESSGVAVVG